MRPVAELGAPPAAPPPSARGRSLGADAWRRLRRNRAAVASGITVAFITFMCFIGAPILGLVTGLDGTRTNIPLGAVGPSWAHPMGTDTLGRDMLMRVLEGGKWAILVAITATAIAVIIGVAYGAIAGYVGGRTDDLMMRLVDTLYGFPTVVFVIVVMAVFELKSLVVLFGLIGAISWLTMARIVRAQVVGLRHREFVEAARALGVRPATILFRHIVPNTLGVVVVYATLLMPGVMLTEAFLSFLGLGVQAPLASWGTLVTEGSTQILVYSWLLVGPGLVMSITVLALNFLGDGLRDALDPRSRKD
ncbi:MAG: ABC transporter permease [Kofleriaceae bacterium]